MAVRISTFKSVFRCVCYIVFANCKSEVRQYQMLHFSVFLKCIIVIKPKSKDNIGTSPVLLFCSVEHYHFMSRCMFFLHCLLPYTWFIWV